MTEETEHELIRDLAELVNTSRALRIADEAAAAAINQAVRDAGLAVSKTINQRDATSIVTARESITQCRVRIGLLRLDIERARALTARALDLQDAADRRRRGD